MGEVALAVEHISTHSDNCHSPGSNCQQDERKERGTVDFKAFRRKERPTEEAPFIIKCEVQDAVRQPESLAFME